MAKQTKLPAVPFLRAALVARVEYERAPRSRALDGGALKGSTTDAIRRAALAAARMGGGKQCFFCGDENPQKKGVITPRKIDWERLSLCPCLADLRRDRVFYHPAETPDDLLAIARAVDARTIRDYEPVFTATCSGRSVEKGEQGVNCDARFTIRAGSLAHSVRGFLARVTADDVLAGRERTDAQRLKGFLLPRRCIACRNKARQQAESQRPPTKAAKSRRRAV